MRFSVSGVTVELEGVTQEQYDEIRAFLDNQLTRQTKARTAVCNAFLHAVKQVPQANPSDIWHHIIYRRFTETSKQGNPGQRWVRVSGEALEAAFAEYYKTLLDLFDL